MCGGTFMKTKKMTALLALMLLLPMSGCAWFNRDGNMNQNGTNGTNQTDGTNTNPPANERPNSDGTSSNREHTIQDMLNSFETSGIKLMNMQSIDKMEFAAHEGRMFELNGETAYLYRMNMEDASMKQLMQEAKDKGSVSVNADGSDQEYSAMVNGDYILLYKKNASIAPLDEAFKNYKPTNNNPNNNHQTNTK